jgi:hypothetical protein
MIFQCRRDEADELLAAHNNLNGDVLGQGPAGSSACWTNSPAQPRPRRRISNRRSLSQRSRSLLRERNCRSGRTRRSRKALIQRSSSTPAASRAYRVVWQFLVLWAVAGSRLNFLRFFDAAAGSIKSPVVRLGTTRSPSHGGTRETPIMSAGVFLPHRADSPELRAD